ncbi:MAG: GNAT family N-acetyltransferase [Candidatus Latescibacterota bacterium]
MRDRTTDTVARFYSQRACYPLETLAAGRVTVAEPTVPPDGALPWVLWVAVLSDRAVLVAPGDFAPTLRRAVRGRAPGELMEPDCLADLSARCAALAGEGTTLEPYLGRKCCCDAGRLRAVRNTNVRQLTPANAPQAMRRPQPVGIPNDTAYLLADDAAFAYYLGHEPVAFAGTHPVGAFSDRLGNVMVGTLQAHRGRGFGRAVVAATTQALVTGGRVAVWGMAHDNAAAARTAASVGYEQYCEVFELRGGQPIARHEGVGR